MDPGMRRDDSHCVGSAPRHLLRSVCSATAFALHSRAAPLSRLHSRRSNTQNGYATVLLDLPTLRQVGQGADMKRAWTGVACTWALMLAACGGGGGGGGGGGTTGTTAVSAAPAPAVAAGPATPTTAP